MPDTLRRKLLWLIGGRAAVITLLLGSAILIQSKAPGTLPIDPFFFLIAVTYGLTALWALTLRFVDAHPWLIDVQLACDAVIVSAIVQLTGGVASYFSSLYALPIIAASTVQSWRGGMMVSVLSSLMYAGLVVAQYQGGSPLPAVVSEEALAARARCGLHRRPQRVRIHGGRDPERLPGGRAAADGRAARGSFVGAREPPGVQRLRHQQHDERPGDVRHRRADADLQCGRDRHHRHSVGRARSEGRRSTCSSCRRHSVTCSTALKRSRRCRGWNTPSHARTGGRSRWGSAARSSTRRAARAASSSPSRTSRPRRSRSARRACSSAWRPLARWPPASRTRYATPSRRWPGRSRFCGTSCRSRLINRS